MKIQDRESNPKAVISNTDRQCNLTRVPSPPGPTTLSASLVLTGAGRGPTLQNISKHNGDMNDTLPSAFPVGEPFPSVTSAVAALTQQQLDRLLQIARRRIERLTQSSAVQRLLSQCEPADFVHEAIMLVLIGELKPGEGRRTHSRHLNSSCCFFNFLQGIVHSRISARLGKTVREGEHLSVEAQQLLGNRTVVQDVQLNEIKTVLYKHLCAAAGDNPALRSTLLLLELEAPSIDKEPSRFQLHKMRKLGRLALKELAAGDEARDLFLP
jgi:hypothetical protein